MKDGRFSHPLAERRFATSALALSHLQTAIQRRNGETNAGVFEEAGDGPSRMIYRVVQDADRNVTITKVAEAIREEPEMATKSDTTKRRTRKTISDAEIAEMAEVAEAAVEAAEIAQENGASQEEIENAAVAAAEAVVEAKANGRASVDRDAVAKVVKGKMTRAGLKDRIAEDRYEAAVKYGIRMQLHKDGLRTKPTDYARHGLTKDDVSALAEALGV